MWVLSLFTTPHPLWTEALLSRGEAGQPHQELSLSLSCGAAWWQWLHHAMGSEPPGQHWARNCLWTPLCALPVSSTPVKQHIPVWADYMLLLSQNTVRKKIPKNHKIYNIT